MYAVIVEWDGGKPPSRWYSRLHALAARVRGDKTVSDIFARRSDKGVILQEGAIIVPTESLARVLAVMARNMGAASVQVGEIQFAPYLAPSETDRAVAERINDIMGRRGPKPPKTDYTTVCPECLAVSHVESGYPPLTCPRCHGTAISVRPGFPRSYLYAGGLPGEFWLHSRFAHGEWEPSLIAPQGAPPPVVRGDAVAEQVAAIRLPSAMLTDVRLACRALDAVYIAVTRWPMEKRIAARSRAAAEYALVNRGKRLPFNIYPITPDLLDAAWAVGIAAI